MRLWIIFAVFLLSCVTKPAVQAPLVESLSTSTSTLAACDCPCAALDAGAPVYTQCAKEFSWCGFGGNKVSTQTVRFGVPGMYAYKIVTDWGVQCAVSSFGSDPAPGQNKTCALLQQPSVDASTPTPPVVDASVPSASAVDAFVPPPVVVVDASTPPVPPPSSGAVPRPSYSKGVGFYVVGSKLYDANGQEFIIRGTNRTHWDSNAPGLANTGANALREIIDFTRPAATNVAMLKAYALATKQVVIPGNWGGTCNEDPAKLTAMVDTWVSQAADWVKLERWSIINIANEFGPSNSTAWRDMYITAVQRLRAAGYHATISITAGGCGQDPKDLVLYGKAVFDADPEKNVILDQHVYGFYSDAADKAFPPYPEADITTHFAALKATGVPVMIGEFGPGRSIGPSDTPVRPERIMQVAQENGLGWLSWSFDDNNLANGMSDDSWFGHSYTGAYTQSSDLTIFGRTVIESVPYGLKAAAKPATVFP